MIVESGSQAEDLSETHESVALVARVRDDAADQQTAIEVASHGDAFSLVDLVDLDVTVSDSGRWIAENRLASRRRSVPAFVDVAGQSSASYEHGSAYREHSLRTICTRFPFSSFGFQEPN